MSIRTQAGLVFLVLLVVGLPQPVAAENFRIENKVFLNNDKEPITESCTIFFEDVVYDFLEKPPEITLFDKARQRFVLLDPRRKVRTELSMDEILQLNEKLKQTALRQSDPLFKFLAEPQFEERIDEKTHELVLESPFQTYRVTAVEADTEAIAHQFRESSDWLCRLNTRLNPGSRLPFPRMYLADLLEKRKQVPTQILLTARSSKGLPFQKVTLRSEHRIVRGLIRTDRERITQAGQYLAVFQSVNFAEYRKPPERQGNVSRE